MPKNVEPIQSSSSDINQFVETQRAKSKGKVKSAIRERWNTRVIPRGLDKSGAAGARAYLESYGKGIAAPKVIELAVCAEAEGANDMAGGFWEEAYFLSTGKSEPFAGAGAGGTKVASVAPVTSKRAQAAHYPSLPEDLQPGKLHTMQPTDAPEDRSKYIYDPEYVGQPKRDGCRNVVFADADSCVHQSRSTSLMAGLGDFDKAAMAVAEKVGPFVLDGERYYLSAAGSEHRTAAQAATANIEAGKGDVLPLPVFGAFKALFYKGQDLRRTGEKSRVEAGEEIISELKKKLPAGAEVAVEAVPTAFTTSDKKALVSKQQAEGREGEVWTLADCQYTGGKGHKTHTVRTKYVTEETFTVVGVTTSTSKSRGVASIEVADAAGNIVGNVGTGFDAASSAKIIKEHQRSPGQVKVVVRYQGRTEKMKIWHARLLEVL